MMMTVMMMMMLMILLVLQNMQANVIFISEKRHKVGTTLTTLRRGELPWCEPERATCPNRGRGPASSLLRAGA